MFLSSVYELPDVMQLSQTFHDKLVITFLPGFGDGS